MNFGKEITVLVDMTLGNLIDLLNKDNFILRQEYDIDDIYLVKKDFDLNNDIIDILNNSVLIRNIITDEKNIKQITYKYKECNDDGEITKNGKVDCIVESVDEAKKLLGFLGYKDLITINDHVMVYSNDIMELAIEYVNNKHIYIEIEEEGEFSAKHYDNVEEMINDFNKLNIPIKDKGYFVKKAEIEFNEHYR